MIFIFYKRDKPSNIDFLSRLKKRLPEKHPKYVEVCQDLYNESIRLGEEELVQQELSSFHFPKPFAVFQNLYVHDSQASNIQIDWLIATPRFFMILEVKNWSDLMDFKDFLRRYSNDLHFYKNISFSLFSS